MAAWSLVDVDAARRLAQRCHRLALVVIEGAGEGRSLLVRAGVCWDLLLYRLGWGLVFWLLFRGV